MTAPIKSKSNNVTGIALALVAGFLVVVLGAIGKKLSGEMSSFVVTFFFSLFSLITVLPWMVRSGFQQIRSNVPVYQSLRAIFFTAGLLLWFWALPHVQLADMTAISYTSSLFVLIGAILFLGEPSRLWRWGALLVGFAGMMIVLRPGSSEFSVWLLVIMSVSFLMSITRLIAKVVMRSDSPLSIVLWLGAWSTILTLPFAWADWQNPTFSQYIWLFVMGLIGTVQQILSMWSIKVADFGVLEPANFMKLVWAAALGFVIFADVPSTSTMIGGTIIVASVIFVARREQLEARARKLAGSEGGEL